MTTPTPAPPTALATPAQPEQAASARTGQAAGTDPAPVTTARTAQPTAQPKAPLIALSLGYFLVMLDVTVVNVAIPDIRTSLGTGATALQWIVDGYSTLFAGLLLFGGALADRVGHRRTFLTGLGVFTLASLICALAGSPAALIAGRLVQGAGAALLVPASLGLLQTTYPHSAVRARAVAVWGAVASVAFGAGPAVGGLLIASSGWRAVFWLNLPVAALAVALTLRHLPPTARPRRRKAKADPLGQLLGVVGLIALAGGLNEVGSRGWTSPLVLSAVGLGLAALVAFAAVERALEARVPAGGRRAPLLPPSLFRSRAVTTTTTIGLLISLGYYGMLFLTTLYFQQERGFSALATGLALLPSVCMGLVAAPLFSRMATRTGTYAVMAAGLVLGMLGFLGWLPAGPHTPYPVLLFALIATGLGQTMTALAATATLVDAAPVADAGIASAVFNVSRQVGSTIGVALFGTFATTASGFTAGLRLSTGLAAAAFATGALLALTARRRAATRTTSAT
ncbi:MFS transporter [Streptomyces sp. NPDC048172]|uniref:MFS transporter n=1 Tax=Streptomyces sp. NPDC048172 TaxID=3365505 RepID=UPI00371D2C1A